MSFNDLRKGRYSEAGRAYFVTATTAERQRWFDDFQAARILIGQLKRLHDEHEVESLAWVVMPDHFHWLFVLNEKLDLSRLVNKLKGRSARAINAYRQRRGAVWQPAFHDHALRKEEDLPDIARYIVANPLRAKLVSKLADYPHWDAVWLDADRPSGPPDENLSP
jgi:REP element-mobilizing transposase RayT